MKATIAWWDLQHSQQTIESLRDYLKQEGVKPWESVLGMRLKFWISDPKKNLWGAVMLWESAEYMTQPLPPNRATQLIGYSPSIRQCFDVQAMTEGNCIMSNILKQQILL